MATKQEDIVALSTTLTPLNSHTVLHRGLIAVTALGFLSFFTSVALFLRLAYKLLTWRRSAPSGRINQFIILIFNLVFADIQQSIAFWLNVEWLRQNSITVGTSTCWAQGWFVSTGDLSSGLFTLAIAVHSFGDIVYDYRLGHKAFLGAIASLWTFNYMVAAIGVAMHPADLYVRAGAWCWINIEYTNERLYLHYFWVIIAEFGTVLIYATIFVILQRRIKSSFYSNSDTAIRARSAMRLIIAYPIVYVVCTLPLVKARLTSMAKEHVSFLELTIAASMITSNGWIDVLLYTLTRRALIFGPDLPDDKAKALDTFRLRPDDAFGTTTVIEANALGPKPGRRYQQRLEDSRHGSTEELFDARNLSNVKAETTVTVRTDTIQMQPLSPDFSEHESGFDTRSNKSGKSSLMGKPRRHR